jgi:hypothetical protein
MNKHHFLRLTLVLAAGAVMGGCGKKDEANPVPVNQANAPVGKGQASTAPAVGLNPNFQGPANGGVGSRAGGN